MARRRLFAGLHPRNAGAMERTGRQRREKRLTLGAVVRRRARRGPVRPSSRADSSASTTSVMKGIVVAPATSSSGTQCRWPSSFLARLNRRGRCGKASASTKEEARIEAGGGARGVDRAEQENSASAPSGRCPGRYSRGRPCRRLHRARPPGSGAPIRKFGFLPTARRVAAAIRGSGARSLSVGPVPRAQTGAGGAASGMVACRQHPPRRRKDEFRRHEAPLPALPHSARAARRGIAQHDHRGRVPRSRSCPLEPVYPLWPHCTPTDSGP